MFIKYGEDAFARAYISVNRKAGNSKNSSEAINPTKLNYAIIMYCCASNGIRYVRH